MEVASIDLMNIIGGGKVKTGIALAFGALISLIVGIIDGYVRPLKCNS